MVPSTNLIVVLLLCVVYLCRFVVTISFEDGTSRHRESRKLFGGYRITPRFCKATKEISTDLKGPTMCMFNHECVQRNGLVVGACMDGFLFGTCCQLPDGIAGELALSELSSAQSPNNNIQSKPTETLGTKVRPAVGLITSSGVSQITNSLLGGLLPTAQDNAVVQIDNHDNNFISTGVTHPISADTIIQGFNDIDPNEFKPAIHTTMSTIIAEETPPSLKFTVTSKPQYVLSGSITRPGFRPKPQKPDGDKYVLVPTILHESKPNKTQELESIVNIIQMLNTTTTKQTTQRYVPTKSTPVYITSTYRPINSKKPSTAFFSSTIPTKLTTQEQTKKVYVQSSTFRPVTYSTFANSPEAFITKKPSTSYIYSSTISKRPNTETPPPQSPIYSSFPSPTPTVIVLSTPDYSTPSPSPKPPQNKPPPRKPITQVTINQHITNNIYNSSEKPSPTVLITPKPSSTTTFSSITEYDEVSFESETSPNDNNNFPPVRNPNLNMSVLPSINENDITTPVFIEDAALNITVESFVNKIIQGLQEPFHGLKDIVYDNSNKTSHSGSTTKKPHKKTGTTTKRPVTTRATLKSTTKRPISTIVTKKPTTTIPKKTKPTKKPSSVITTTETILSSDEPLDQDYRSVCGLRPLVRSSRIVGGKEASYGEFPWQVLVRESTWLGLFTKNKCGGVLISNRYVMTAAHCQPGFLASLVAVFGEFDISGNKEEKVPLSRNIKRVIVHRQYDPNTFANDLALLELDQPVIFDKHIIPICLPREGEDFTGRMATVTGWGRLKYGGGVPSILQEVQVPIMENEVCQTMFQTAGHTKTIYGSFLCAGYANGQKDSCEGDSGGPLVLLRPDGKYQLAGTVSHGIKCAAPYLPGVYMRTSFYKPWIESITGVH
ncbi:serine protease filzig [Onthophagus taurus]|uniref:serine protease filzig n=1 Tax=Onthophagus taurus TaxID=166361 RepID=UPI000C208012|nr:serine proteinase stubble [Onthophagus taurus]